MFDLIIIGAGPGGYEVAVRAAKAGKQVVIFEAKALGGTCLNEGCIPTKCLCHSAEVLPACHPEQSTSPSCHPEQSTSPACHPELVEGSQFSIKDAMARKSEVVSTLSSGIRGLMGTPGITLVESKARFVDAHTVAAESGETYSAPHIIIAVGSVAKRLPIPGADLPGVITSTELLDIDHVPARLAVIGGGVIGLEFASIFSKFGSEVTVIEYCKEVLPNFDRDTAKRLRTSLKKRGISFHVGAGVKAIEEVDGAYSVTYEEKGKEASVLADTVLMATGRGANLSALNLADVGIEFTPRGIVVDENMQTNIPGIYAVGDVNGLCQLAHAATFQSYRALNHILGKADGIRFDIVPAAVFTVPEVAMVGLTEEQCEERGIGYTAHKSFYRANGKALSMDESEGIVKILTDESDKVIGCHILGAHASDLIHEISLLMNFGGTLSQLTDCIHAHPSLSEIFLA